MPSRKKEKEERERGWVSAGRGEWVARIESLPGGPAATPQKTVPQRVTLESGQELWTAPPFPEGTILEVETTMGYAYLITVLSPLPSTGRRGGL